MLIQQMNPATLPEWVTLRMQLWPHHCRELHMRDGNNILLNPEKLSSWLAITGSGEAVGFADCSLRHDYVNGCAHVPVAFLEGIFVVGIHRKQGVAASLIITLQNWACVRGCRELASDTALNNIASQKMHRALGFQETERVVFFRKKLP